MKCSLHNRLREKNPNQKKVFFVITLTLAMMIVEIVAGLLFGSMALLADGVHMGTHFFALSITLVAYIFANKHATNRDFAFGTGKISSLGGYSSAIVLIISALGMMWESTMRLSAPININFSQSILVAVIGLTVNLFSAFLLKESHHHTHHHHDSRNPSEHTHHQDHNIKAAYLHVIADALTSVLAIVALIAAKTMGWIWLDPLVGILGGIIIIKWGVGLLISSSAVLLDHDKSEQLKQEVLNIVNDNSTGVVSDYHAWRVDENKRAIICSIEGCHNLSEQKMIRDLVQKTKRFCHITLDFQ